MKTHSKKAKKYSHTKDCKEQPREIYDQYEKKPLKPVWFMQDRLVWTYEAEETCRDEEKKVTKRKWTAARNGLERLLSPRRRRRKRS